MNFSEVDLRAKFLSLLNFVASFDQAHLLT